MFVVIGEALVDLVGQRGSRTLVAHPGGSPANVALGLGRLGNPVTLMTHLGQDSFGEMISVHLQASGVRVEGGTAEGSSTSLAVATLAAGIATYDFRIEWDIGGLEPLPIAPRRPETAPHGHPLPAPRRRGARAGAGTDERTKTAGARAPARQGHHLLRPQ